MEALYQHSPSGRAGIGMACQAAIVCRVPGCLESVPESEYHRRCKICLVHQSASIIVLDGQNCRWCGLCKKFHPLEEFEDDKRSCEAALGRHNARRRQRRGGAAGSGGGHQPAGNSPNTSSWEEADPLPAMVGWAPAGMPPPAGSSEGGVSHFEPAAGPPLPPQPPTATDVWGGHGPALESPTLAEGSVLMPPLQFHELPPEALVNAGMASEAGPDTGVPHRSSPYPLQPHQQPLASLQQQHQHPVLQQQQQQGSVGTAGSSSAPGPMSMNLNMNMAAAPPPPELVADLGDISMALSGLDLKDMPPIPSVLSLEGLSVILRSLVNSGQQGGALPPEVPPELANISLADLSMALGSLHLPALPEDASMELCSMADLSAVLAGVGGPTGSAEPGPARPPAAAAAAPQAQQQPQLQQLAPGARLLLAELSARLPPELRSLTLSELSLELGPAGSAQARENVLALLGALGEQLPSLASGVPLQTLRSLEYLERRASQRHLKMELSPEVLKGHPAEPQQAQQAQHAQQAPLAAAGGGGRTGLGQEAALPAWPAGQAGPAGACWGVGGSSSGAARQPSGSQAAAAKGESGAGGAPEGAATAQIQGLSLGQSVRPHLAVNLRDFVQPPPPANFFLERGE